MKNRTYYYPQGSMYTQAEKDKFFDELARIREMSRGTTHRFSKAYSVITYDTPEGQIEYWTNDDTGVPYSLVYLNKVEDENKSQA